MHRSFRVALSIAALVHVLPGAASAQRLSRSGPLASIPAAVKLDTTGMFQATYAKVGDDLFIGGQPTGKALRELKAQGVTTVINLRTPEEMQRAVKFDEPALIRELGVTYVYLPVRGNADFPYSPETVTKFAEALRTAPGKVLLHCTVAWRASHLWAAYLIRERGVAERDALAHARAINLMDEHRDSAQAQPVEDFLARRLPTLGKP
jgi:uncharacterized protein (TIGR01244 family)